jgi:hypothetical protein
MRNVFRTFPGVCRFRIHLWQTLPFLVNSRVKWALNALVLWFSSDGTQSASCSTKMGASRNHSQSVPAADSRGVRILAKSVYRELRNSGHSRSDIVAFTNAVLELVTTELRDAQEAAE